MRVESQVQDLIYDIRRNLTKLEFAAMEIDCQNREKDLTAQLAALKSQSESTATAFNAI